MVCNRYFVFVVVDVWLTCFLPVFAIENYCSRNTYDANGSHHLRLTKEASYEEFAVLGRFKGLHCCARGYSSIEWYKNGLPYPWPTTLSQLILYPESANQTIYTTGVSQDDAGNYTCVLKNETVVFLHTIHLTVYEKVPDDPKITYVSRDVEIGIGEPLRLFCEAFVGKVDLPDAISEVRWTKPNINSSVYFDTHIRQKQIAREENQTYGTYLTTEQITKDDYGEYICIVSKPGKSVELRVFVAEKMEKTYEETNWLIWRNLALYFSFTACLLYALYRLYRLFGLPVRVWMKDSFGRVEEEENDGKINDVLLLCSPADSVFAVGVLLPFLQSKTYKCDVCELPANMATWYTKLTDAASKARRIFLVLSPACINNQWDTITIYNALKQLTTLGPQLACLTLVQLPSHAYETKNAQGENLSTLLRNITVLQWSKHKEPKFWLSVVLPLPAKRNQQQQGVTVQSIAVNQNNHSSKRLNNDDCQERLKEVV